MKAQETATIHVLDQILECKIKIASNEEKKRLWDVVINQAPFYDGYRKKLLEIYGL